MAPRKYKKPSKTKRFIKFLSATEDKKLLAAVLKKSPDSVIKSICNAALNAAQNSDLRLRPTDKKAFKRAPRLFWKQVLDPKVSLLTKRKAIQSGGALPLIPIILSTVLSALGSRFLGGKD